MDKDKLLKKFITKFVIGQTLASSFIFLWVYIYEYGYINKDRFIKSGLIILVVAIVFGTIDYLLFNKKRKKERLAVNFVPAFFPSLHSWPSLTPLDSGQCRLQ